ncbi:DUF1552 domain-containing protein [bacterium]|nr:DUF1552 domain-containing protein [bacterium]
MTKRFNRRSILRGAVAGAGVCVGVPALDAFLNGNGSAYADKAALPTRFGTYFWGLGLTDTPLGGSRWVPETVGRGYEATPELISIKHLRHKVSVFSGFRVIGDGKPNVVHWSGHAAILGGEAPARNRVMAGPSFDTAVADALGAGMRFKQVDVAASGGQSACHSTRNGATFATPETTPLELYQRLFGEGFQDPNDPNWTPDPSIVLRRSVLSGIAEQRKALISEVGRSDQLKLDQYFTSLREIEKQLEIQLQRPEPCEACEVPDAPKDLGNSVTIDVVNANSKMLAKLLAMGLACNQTRVFNFVHTPGTSITYIAGEQKTYHQITHDEPTDTTLGYQPKTSELAGLVMGAFGDFLNEMEAIQEGEGTLLDHMLVMAFSDTGYAKIHSLENIPVLFAGGAGGRHIAGQHIASKGEPITRLSLTAQQLVGVPRGEFGMGAMRTSRPVTEVMA